MRIASVFLLSVAVVACKPASTDGTNATSGKPASVKPAPDVPGETTQSAAIKSAPMEKNGALSADGKLVLVGNGVTLEFLSGPCSEDSPGVQLCNRSPELKITLGSGSPTAVPVETVYLDSNASFYQGPLDKTYKKGGHTFIFSDVNGDGHDDLLIWSGRDGNYGGASYDVFLQNASGEFERSDEFSDLTVASGLFRSENGQLETAASDGCCSHVYATYQLKGGKPVLLERVTETADESGKISRKVEKGP